MIGSWSIWSYYVKQNSLTILTTFVIICYTFLLGWTWESNWATTSFCISSTESRRNEWFQLHDYISSTSTGILLCCSCLPLEYFFYNWFLYGMLVHVDSFIEILWLLLRKCNEWIKWSVNCTIITTRWDGWNMTLLQYVFVYRLYWPFICLIHINYVLKC